MKSLRSAPRSLVPLAVAAPGLLALVGLIVIGVRSRSVAAGSGVLRAESICEAQELKARHAQDPGLAVEIPPEFDKPFPSREACSAHALAWADAAPGPRQPIPFSHALHAGTYQISCLYCHTGTERSQAAGLPSLDSCMGCHGQFAAEFDQLEGIRILKRHWEAQRGIEWRQIHRLPEHVQFRHNRHVVAGISCQLCHGAVEQMHRVYLVPDTKWWHYGMPAQKLQMGWCVQCHRENDASTDCILCHY